MEPADTLLPTLSYPFRGTELINALPEYCEAIRELYLEHALMRAQGQIGPEDSLIQLFLIRSFQKGQFDDRGKAITENAVCTFASLLVLPLPISTIQDIIENGGCHAAMVSGEVCFGDSHGIVLQVSMNNFATSYWFKQRRGRNGLVLGVFPMMQSHCGSYQSRSKCKFEKVIQAEASARS
ncbi:hypothetical protein WJX74_006162 [Apatococcus lobatus]|uniref:Uncharacterized protein n=1 Tax=Apatococcus lobatus TaxID=904363 RepID=A0AAW1RKW1_9CHLO